MGVKSTILLALLMVLALPSVAQVAWPTIVPSAPRVIDPERVPYSTHTGENPAIVPLELYHRIGQGEFRTLERVTKTPAAVDSVELEETYTGTLKGFRVNFKDQGTAQKKLGVSSAVLDNILGKEGGYIAFDEIIIRSEEVPTGPYKSTTARASAGYFVSDESEDPFLAAGSELGRFVGRKDNDNRVIENVMAGLAAGSLDSFTSVGFAFGQDSLRDTNPDLEGDVIKAIRRVYKYGIGFLFPFEFVTLHSEVYGVTKEPYQFANTRFDKVDSVVSVTELRIWWLVYAQTNASTRIDFDQFETKSIDWGFFIPYGSVFMHEENTQISPGTDSSTRSTVASKSVSVNLNFPW